MTSILALLFHTLNSHFGIISFHLFFVFVTSYFTFCWLPPQCRSICAHRTRSASSSGVKCQPQQIPPLQSSQSFCLCGFVNIGRIQMCMRIYVYMCLDIFECFVVVFIGSSHFNCSNAYIIMSATMKVFKLLKWKSFVFLWKHFHFCV